MSVCLDGKNGFDGTINLSLGKSSDRTAIYVSYALCQAFWRKFFWFSHKGLRVPLSGGHLVSNLLLDKFLFHLVI